MVKGPGAEAAEELLDEEGVPGAGHTDQHKPNFVKHLNKTRTFSAKQKWEWAFDKILTVSGNFFSNVHIFWESHKIWKNLPILFDIT